MLEPLNKVADPEWGFNPPRKERLRFAGCEILDPDSTFKIHLHSIYNAHNCWKSWNIKDIITLFTFARKNYLSYRDDGSGSTFELSQNPDLKPYFGSRSSLVLILDGTSEHVTLVWRKQVMLVNSSYCCRPSKCILKK